MVATPFVTFALSAPAPLAQPAVPLAGSVASASGSAATFGPVSWIPAAPQRESVLTWVVLLWLAGASAFWVRLMGGWWIAARMRSQRVRPAPPEWQATLDQLGARIRLTRPVRLLISALVEVPTVVGWLRPVVLVPVAALAGLPPEHVEALLAHELAHIRRRDFLVNVLQSIAEALLFYHPAVWWVSGHIRAEREFCCDDIAVSVTGDVLTYARALAELESARPTHLRAAMAASGGSVAHRIARLLGQARPASGIVPGPGIVAAAMLLAITAFALFGQPSPSARPKFEVAAIKPSLKQGYMTVRPLPGRLTADASIQLLIRNAYAVQPFQIVGGPAWLGSRYEIDAKADGNASRAQMFLMLQSLLEERFQLKIHREMRELPIYALVPARTGLKLPPPKEGSCVQRPDGPPDWAGGRIAPPEEGRPPLPPCGSASVLLAAPAGARIQGGKLSMPEFVRALSMVLGRTVIDKTGFTGFFDLGLDFLPDEITPALPPPPPDSAGAPPVSNSPSILTAIQEQLGLRLEATKGPVEILVIDHVEKPTEN
jgi:uncharacterized protein (TIGR03435 family)